MDRTTNELSRPVPLAALGIEPVKQDVVATEAECAALARRFDLPAIADLDGTVTLARQPGTIIRATGSLRATVRRICVVTLEPFDQTVEDSFTLYLTDAPDVGPGDELDIALEDEDAPEPVEGDAIDCGELVAQQLLLALDPFPHSPAAREAGPVARTDPAEEPHNPFRSLRDLIR
jgi:uncharacterized metal-binding protein YceD (DUF177 family)